MFSVCNKNMRNTLGGITLIEILVVIAISAILSVGSMAAYSNYNKKKSFELSIQNVGSLIEEARFITLASKDSSVYGVHFESGRAVLFKGATFSEPSSDNKEYTLPNIVEISVIDLNGGGNNVVFDRLTGETSQYGTTTISLVNDVTTTSDIVVRQTGIVEF